MGIEGMTTALILHPDADEILFCGNCGKAEVIDVYDTIMACPGNVFCVYCHTEIDSSTGVVAIPCGKCGACLEIQQWERDVKKQGSLF